MSSRRGWVLLGVAVVAVFFVVAGVGNLFTRTVSGRACRGDAVITVRGVPPVGLDGVRRLEGVLTITVPTSDPQEIRVTVVDTAAAQRVLATLPPALANSAKVEAFPC
ncbi:MAG TPA: hypothetical protein VHD82_13710 [Amycolatopsis sp.]|nr:hypothetical protein [Amycolatopsis sp.]